MRSLGLRVREHVPAWTIISTRAPRGPSNPSHGHNKRFERKPYQSESQLREAEQYEAARHPETVQNCSRRDHSTVSIAVLHLPAEADPLSSDRRYANRSRSSWSENGSRRP